MRCRTSSGERRLSWSGGGAALCRDGAVSANTAKHVYKCVCTGDTCTHARPGACDVFLFNRTDGGKQRPISHEDWSRVCSSKVWQVSRGVPRSTRTSVCAPGAPGRCRCGHTAASCGRGPCWAPGADHPRAAKRGLLRESLSTPHASRVKVCIFIPKLARFNQFPKHSP